MKHLIISLLLISFSGVTLAQGSFSIKNPRKNQQYFFHEGDFFRFQMKDDPGTYGAYLHGAGDGFLEISFLDSLSDEDFNAAPPVIRIETDAIYAILDPRTTGFRKFRRLTAGVLTLGASAFITVSSIHAITEGVEPSPVAHLTAAGVLAGAFALRYAGKEKLVIGRPWELHVQPSTPDIQPYIVRFP